MQIEESRDVEQNKEQTDFEFIWGLPAREDKGETAGLHTINDIEVIYNKKTKSFAVFIEAGYHFNDTESEVEYLHRLMDSFTEWMIQHGYQVSNKRTFYDVFTGRNRLFFRSLEAAYEDLKLRIAGYEAQCSQ